MERTFKFTYYALEIFVFLKKITKKTDRAVTSSGFRSEGTVL
ncbi:MAG: hypothetical protein ABFR75_05480 [Acidobacteriota bacterium]